MKCTCSATGVCWAKACWTTSGDCVTNDWFIVCWGLGDCIADVCPTWRALVVLAVSLIVKSPLSIFEFMLIDEFSKVDSSALLLESLTDVILIFPKKQNSFN